MLVTVWEFLERFVFDPSLVDLVVWFPHLTWREFAVSAGTVFAWKYVSDRIERFIMYRVRMLAAALLMKLALIVKPSR